MVRGRYDVPFWYFISGASLDAEDALQRYPKSELTIGKHEFRKDECNEYSRSHTYSGREKTMGA
jgi:hypothetical protein